MMSFPFEIKDVEPEIRKELSTVFYRRKDGYLHVGPKKFFLYSKYREQAAGYFNMELRPDDVWVVSFPRAGSNWTQELVWLVNNNLDYDRALKESAMDRWPFLERSMLIREEYKKEVMESNKGEAEIIETLNRISEPGYEEVARMGSPRHVKTHLPMSLLPPTLLDTCKVVYVARNPKDAAVSYFHLNRLLKDLADDVDFPKYWDLFQRDMLLWTPFWGHVEEAWELKDHPNMLFMFYEDMKKDLPAVIRRVAAFFNKDVTQEQVSKLAEHLHISNFRNNPALQKDMDKLKGMKKEGEPGFYRKGESGAWRSVFPPELNARADEWIRENERRTDLRFHFG